MGFVGLTAVSLWGQSSGSVVIESDIRLFTAMAALNAAGFDTEIAREYHPVRNDLRKLTEQLSPDLRARLKQFYEAHKGDEADQDQLAKYVSYAVTAGDPPAFRPLTREENLPPDARTIAGFSELMGEVYAALKLNQRWAEVRAEYERELSGIAPRVRESILRVDAYLRVPLGGVTSRTMAIYAELAAPVNSVNVRSYQDNYFVVLGHSTSPRINDIRHAYLHFMLDGLVIRNLTRIENSKDLVALLDGVSDIQVQYTSDFHILVTESLIRAIELRLDRVDAKRAQELTNAAYRGGLLLAPYFMEALPQYEAAEAGIRDLFKDIASGVDVKAEVVRFQQTFHSIQPETRPAMVAEVPVAPEPPKVDPVRQLLKQGEASLNAGNFDEARQAFQKVVNDLDSSNGAAWYGLGFIASRDQDSEAAKEYLEKAVNAPALDPSMKVWSLILLGRIYDLECDRDRAVEFYQRALGTGDDSRNARNAAREALEKPFGGGCK